MKQYIKDLLMSPPGVEIEIIQNLDLAGDGDLRAGVRNVWGSGVRVGSVVATVILGGSCLLYWLMSRKQRVWETVETVETAFNVGFEVGKQQEREFREFIEKGAEIMKKWSWSREMSEDELRSIEEKMRSEIYSEDYDHVESTEPYDEHSRLVDEINSRSSWKPPKCEHGWYLPNDD